MSSTITPRGEYVLVAPMTVEEKTAAGIYRADAQEEKSGKAEVIAVGTDVTGLAEGDTVICKQYGGESVTLDGAEYQLVKQEDVLATVTA